MSTKLSQKLPSTHPLLDPIVQDKSRSNKGTVINFREMQERKRLRKIDRDVRFDPLKELAHDIIPLVENEGVCYTSTVVNSTEDELFAAYQNLGYEPKGTDYNFSKIKVYLENFKIRLGCFETNGLFISMMNYGDPSIRKSLIKQHCLKDYFFSAKTIDIDSISTFSRQDLENIDYFKSVEAMLLTYTLGHFNPFQSYLIPLPRLDAVGRVVELGYLSYDRSKLCETTIDKLEKFIVRLRQSM